MQDFIIKAIQLLIVIGVTYFMFSLFRTCFRMNKFSHDPAAWERYVSKQLKWAEEAKKSAHEPDPSVLPRIAEELRKESGFPTEKKLFVVGSSHNAPAPSAQREDEKLTITISAGTDDSATQQSTHTYEL